MLSGNPLAQISRGDLANLASLESLDLSNLPACMKIDSQAFATLPSLRSLRLFGLPRLESLHSRAILQHISTLEEAEIEVTEPALQDQLAPAFLPRVRELHVHGRGIFFRKLNLIASIRLLDCYPVQSFLMTLFVIWADVAYSERSVAGIIVADKSYSVDLF